MFGDRGPTVGASNGSTDGSELIGCLREKGSVPYVFSHLSYVDKSVFQILASRRAAAETAEKRASGDWARGGTTSEYLIESVF